VVVIAAGAERTTGAVLVTVGWVTVLEVCGWRRVWRLDRGRAWALRRWRETVVRLVSDGRERVFAEYASKLVGVIADGDTLAAVRVGCGAEAGRPTATVNASSPRTAIAATVITARRGERTSFRDDDRCCLARARVTGFRRRPAALGPSAALPSPAGVLLARGMVVACASNHASPSSGKLAASSATAAAGEDGRSSS